MNGKTNNALKFLKMIPVSRVLVYEHKSRGDAMRTFYTIDELEDWMIENNRNLSGWNRLKDWPRIVEVRLSKGVRHPQFPDV